MATETSISQPAPVGMSWGLSQLNLQCWEVSPKEGSHPSKNDLSWLLILTKMNIDFSSEYTNETKAFNMKDHVLHLATLTTNS